MEAWLPANWTGRFLSAGNGGLAGCIGYDVMAYGTGYGFASVGANNGQCPYNGPHSILIIHAGHNGTSGGAFLNNDEVVTDFAWRS